MDINNVKTSNKSITKTMKVWIVLSIISVMNVLYMFYFLFFIKKNNDMINIIYTLTLIYVLVCTIRAIWLKNVTERFCLFNFPLSSPLLDRFLSTVSELSFVLVNIILIQCLILKIYKKIYPKMNYLFIIIFSLIVVAEINSWFGVIIQNYLFTFIEESIWGIFGIFLLIIYICLLKKVYIGHSKNMVYLYYIIIPAIIFSILFIYYIIKYDLPNWINKWYIFNKNKFVIFPKDFFKKCKDMLNCKRINNSFDIWKDDLLFYSLYFIFAVWASMYILYFFNKYLI